MRLANREWVVTSPTYWQLPVLIDNREMVQADWSDESRAGHIAGLVYWRNFELAEATL